MMWIHKETRQALEKAASDMKKQYNKRKGSSWNYSVGDKVWLDNHKPTTPKAEEETG